MPRLTPRIPSYRRHKATGQAVVTLNGRDSYLGRFGSAASRQEYERLIAEWLASQRTPPASTTAKQTINEVLLAYLPFAESYYQNSNEFANMKLALRPLRELYGRTAAASFGPLALKAVREKMITAELSRLPQLSKKILRARGFREVLPAVMRRIS